MKIGAAYSTKLGVLASIRGPLRYHGKEVTKWVEKIKERIELSYLPAYSPEFTRLYDC